AIRQSANGGGSVLERGLKNRVVVGAEEHLLFGKDEPFGETFVIERKAFAVEGEDARAFRKIRDDGREQSLLRHRREAELIAAAHLESGAEVEIGGEPYDIKAGGAAGAAMRRCSNDAVRAAPDDGELIDRGREVGVITITVGPEPGGTLLACTEAFHIGSIKIRSP